VTCPSPYHFYPLPGPRVQTRPSGELQGQGHLRTARSGAEPCAVPCVIARNSGAGQCLGRAHSPHWKRQLTNEVRGWGSVQFGQIPLRRLIAYYRAEPARVRHPPFLCGSIDCTSPRCGKNLNCLSEAAFVVRPACCLEFHRSEAPQGLLVHVNNRDGRVRFGRGRALDSCCQPRRAEARSS
jgi:hypothetical protein